MGHLFLQCIIFLLIQALDSKPQKVLKKSYTENYEKELFKEMARIYEILRHNGPSSAETTKSKHEIIQDGAGFQTAAAAYRKSEKFGAERRKEYIPLHKNILKHNFREDTKASARACERGKNDFKNCFKTARPMQRQVSKQFKKLKGRLSDTTRSSLRSINSIVKGKQFQRVDKEQRRHWRSSVRRNISIQIKVNAPGERKMYNQMPRNEFDNDSVNLSITQPETEILSTANTTAIGGETQETTSNYLFITSFSPAFESHILSTIESNDLATSSDETTDFKEQEKTTENIKVGKLDSETKQNRDLQSINKVENRVKHDVLFQNQEDFNQSTQSHWRDFNLWKNPYFIGVLSGILVLMVLLFLALCVFAVGKQSFRSMEEKRNKSLSTVYLSERSENLTDIEEDYANELHTVHSDKSMKREFFQPKQRKNNRNHFGLETILEESLRNHNLKINECNDLKSTKTLIRECSRNHGEKLIKLHKNVKMKQQGEKALRQKTVAGGKANDRQKRVKNDASNDLFNPEKSQERSSDSEDEKIQQEIHSSERLKQLFFLDMPTIHPKSKQESD